MPDFERLIDDLQIHLATNPEQRSWAKGYRAGKKRARLEVIAVVVSAYFIVALIGHLASA